MKKCYQLMVLLVVLALLVLAGCKKDSAGTGGTVSEGTASSQSSVPTGYYNLADFETLAGKKIDAFKEAPKLAAKVSAGELPPVKDRLPANPLVFRTLNTVGEYGGTMRITSTTIDYDVTLRHINAANLIEQPANAGWDVVSTVFGAPKQPGVLESFGMNDDGTVFTATIRKGLKWSDGVPVTTKDVSFRIKDILLNKELTPVSPNWLIWGGKDTVFTIVDDYTFSFTFSQPFGAFIESEVSLWPGTFFRLMLPRHYLEKFHKDYNTEDNILRYMKADGRTNFNEWKEWFNAKPNLFREEYHNIEITGEIPPTLSAWVLAEDLGNGNYRLDRNPYYYMVDQDGNQLPYIDSVISTYSGDTEVDNMAIISGQVDLAGSTQALQDYPLYKDNEDKGNYTVLPTPHPYDHLFIVLFNENAGIRPPTITSITSASVNEELPNAQYDPGLAAIYTDVRFRRAMSLALNREVFNDTLFMGMGRPAQVSPRPNDPSFREGMDKAYAAYDPTEAKRLLDEMGLKDVNGDGWREQPNGNPFKVRFEYFIISSASTPGVELCKRFWEEVGVQTEPRIIDNTYFNQLVGSNVNEATTWWLGGANANLIQDWFFGPSMIVPLWSRYTRYINSSISQDEWNNKILPYVPEWQREMQDLRLQIKLEPDPQKQIEIGTKIWQLQAEWLPIIGVVTEAPTPLILSRDLGNVEPITDMGLNYIGVMEQAECFYFKNPARRSN